ncbi:Alkaline phosphatase [hydrothermal vent metagenome]|uniref:Alkaline phosphatase n=1 Tax=hydrothermal vent metagenome TaxID=652676 RepID=A0A3B0YRB6_9ZZZZ
MNIRYFFRMVKFVILIGLLAVFSACSENSVSSDATVTKLPLNIEKLAVPSGSEIRAWITIDNNTRTQMLIDTLTGTATVTIPALTTGQHTVLIEYEFSNAGQTLLIASASRSVNLSAGSTTIDIFSSEYGTNFDEDQDGATNISELADGTNPFGLPAFSPECFPLPAGSAGGALVFNYNGDLLIADGSDAIRLMDNETCNVTTLITIAGESLSSVVEDTLRNRLYVGSANTGTVYTINTDDRSSEVLLDTGAVNTSLVMSPSSYEPYAGQLIIAVTGGKVITLDPANAGQPSTTIAALASTASLVFDSNGTLYASDRLNGKVITLAADGSQVDFATGANINVPVSLAVDNRSSRLLILNSGGLNIVSASIPSGEVSVQGSVNISRAGHPGFAYNGRNSLLVSSAKRQIELRPARAFNTSCLALSISGTDDSTSNFTNFGADDLLFTSHSNDIRVLNRTTCTLKVLASNVPVGNGSGLLGIVYDAVRDVIYVADDDVSIYTVNPLDGSSSLLITVAEEAVALAIAPASYAPYGGQLIAALSDGRVVAIDLSKTPATETSLTETVGVLSDLVFGANGVLYVANNSGNRVNTVSASGAVSIFISGLNSPDGLAVDSNGNRLFISNAGVDTLVQVDIADPTIITVLTAADFRPGSFTSGVFFDQYDTLLYGVGDTSLTIEKFGL